MRHNPGKSLWSIGEDAKPRMTASDVAKVLLAAQKSARSDERRLAISALHVYDDAERDYTITRRFKLLESARAWGASRLSGYGGKVVITDTRTSRSEEMP